MGLDWRSWFRPRVPNVDQFPDPPELEEALRFEEIPPFQPEVPAGTPPATKPSFVTKWTGALLRPFVEPHPAHRGAPIRVGPYTIYAGGTRDLRPEDFSAIDLVIPLEPRIVIPVGRRIEVLGCPWQDMGAPPVGFEDLLRNQVIPLLAEGRKTMVYCIGSHGRTGTFLAGLIALTESREETPDPIAAVRSRHCKKCVETMKQAEAIFALRGEELPEKYKEEFAKPVFSMGAYPVSGVNPDQGFLLPGERDWDFPRGPYASSYGGKLPDVVTFRRGSDVPGVSGVRKEGESW